MERKNTGYLVAIIALAVAVVGLSIGFAFSDINLNINGNATAKATSWNIIVNEVQNVTPSGNGVTVNQAPTISGSTSVTYSIALDQIGDTYDFDVITKNVGTYDGHLKNIIITGNNTDYLTHTVTYAGNDYVTGTSNITGAPVLKTNDTETFHVHLEYTDPGDESKLPTTDTKVDYTVTLVYTPDLPTSGS